MLLLAGCATERISTYPPISIPQSLAVLANHSHAVKTISAQALITLTRSNGDTIRLDAALVMNPPDEARLRAWKFGQAVFDMTLTPDGTWIIAPQRDGQAQLLADDANMGKFTRQWLHLMNGFFNDPHLPCEPSASRLTFRQDISDGTTMICQVDRRTLTPREFTLQEGGGGGGARPFTLTLGNYAEYNGIPWPRRIEAISGFGRVLIELRDVEINGEIPGGAFHPPARAEKLP